MKVDDAFKYAAAMLDQRTGWALDAISGSCCDNGHDDELDALYDAIAEVKLLAARTHNPRHYSDGRMVSTSREIQDGLITSHVWQPDVTDEETVSHRGTLPSYDPDIPSPGIYEVTTYPETQEIHVRVVRFA